MLYKPVADCGCLGWTCALDLSCIDCRRFLHCTVDARQEVVVLVINVINSSIANTISFLVYDRIILSFHVILSVMHVSCSQKEIVTMISVSVL